MRTFAIVPVKRFNRSKSRLGGILGAIERRALCELLLVSTIQALQHSGAISKILVVTSERSAIGIASRSGAEILKLDFDNGVNEAIALGDEYSSDNGAEATVVIPQDIPLLTAEDITKLCNRAERYVKCIVICPSIRYDGTNALLRKPPKLIRTFYEEDSFNSHVRAAVMRNVPIKFHMSRRIMMDLDSAEDITILMKEEVPNLTLAYLRSKLRDSPLLDVRSAI